MKGKFIYEIIFLFLTLFLIHYFFYENSFSVQIGDNITMSFFGFFIIFVYIQCNIIYIGYYRLVFILYILFIFFYFFLFLLSYLYFYKQIIFEHNLYVENDYIIKLHFIKFQYILSNDDKVMYVNYYFNKVIDILVLNEYEKDVCRYLFYKYIYIFKLCLSDETTLQDLRNFVNIFICNYLNIIYFYNNPMLINILDVIINFLILLYIILPFFDV